ncbi:MAG: SRPBCC family protein [Pseudomonadota bacterium]
MPHIKGEETLPHPAARIFDVAMDLENYPTILPYIKAVRILSHTSNSMKVTLVLGLSMLRFTHTCDIAYEKNVSIAVTSTNTLFKTFASRCDFVPVGNDAARLNYALNCQFANPIIELLAGTMVAPQAHATIKAFKQYLERT